MRAYKFLGVKHFKKFLINGRYFNSIVKIFNPKRKNVVYDKSTAKKWLNQTITAELIHLVAFLIMFYLMAQSLWNEKYIKVAQIGFLNIVFNLYPIFTQRYNRYRINKIIE